MDLLLFVYIQFPLLLSVKFSMSIETKKNFSICKLSNLFFQGLMNHWLNSLTGSLLFQYNHGTQIWRLVPMQAGAGVCRTYGPVGCLLPACGYFCATRDQRSRLWGPAGVLRSSVDTLFHGGLGHLVQRQHWGSDLQKGPWLGDEQSRG